MDNPEEECDSKAVNKKGFSIDNLLSDKQDESLPQDLSINVDDDDNEHDDDVDDDEGKEDGELPRPIPINGSNGESTPTNFLSPLLSPLAAVDQLHHQHLLYSQWLATRNTSLLFGLQGT